ncbi:FCS-Like Zinc finger 8-like protein [Drosera capensis]
MLRRRQRQVSKNHILSDHFSTKITKPTSYFSNSSLIFHGLFNFEQNSMNMMMSSELESSSNNNNKLFSSSPFSDTKNRGIGLALIDSLIIDKKSTDFEPQNEKRLVIFGSQLKIEVPTSPIQLPISSPNSSPCEFGIKTPRSKFPRFGEMGNEIELVNSTGSISMEEMELSEDYTCVISHGPNPKRTHIFRNYVVVDDVSGGDGRSPAAKRVKDVCDSWSESENGSEGESEGFLRFCHQCNLELGHGKDIFMYRGEKAFCSQECRYRAINAL